MNRGVGKSSAGVAVPVKFWAQRLAFFFFVSAAFTLMLLSKAETVLVAQLRTTTVDGLAPVLAAVSQPVQATRNGVERVNGILLLNAENSRLRRENDLLRGWQNEARRLQAELTALKGQLNMAPEVAPRAVSARVIADTAGVFVQSLLVNAGARDAILRGQASVTVDGLVGRVAEVGNRSARVLLLTDLNSRVPVVLENTRVRGVLAGNNGPTPDLLYLPPNAGAAVGDRVVTSGHGGVFPPGLAVGVVAEATESGVRVQPLVDYDRLSYVQILSHSGEGVLPDPQDDPVARPSVPAPSNPTSGTMSPVETPPVEAAANAAVVPATGPAAPAADPDSLAPVQAEGRVQPPVPSARPSAPPARLLVQ